MNEYSYHSDQIQITKDEPGSFADVSELGGRTRVLHWSFTNNTGGTIASGAQVLIGKLPAGRCRLLRAGEFATSALGASRTGTIGFNAYTDKDGNAVVADPDAFKTTQDLATAANGLAYNAVAGGSWFFNSREGVDITLDLAGGTIPDGGVVQGYFLYIKD